MSVREIIRNKKYQIEIPLGYNGTKKIRHFETFYGGKKDALLREAKLKIQLKEGSFVQKNNLTLQDLSEEYLNYQQNILSPKTFRTYSDRIELINGHIGYVKLRNINAKILDKFYNYLKNEHITVKGTPYSPTTIQSYYAIINNMLEVAIKWDYISYNPNTRIEKPKRTRADVQCYSPDEVDLLLQCVMKEPLKYQAIIILALDLGCRRGELTGLTWDDIDFKTGKVTINKTTQYIDKHIFEKTTKTENSDRVNYITKTTIEILKKYQKEQLEKQLQLGSKWNKTNRVFTTDFGGDIHPDTPTKILDKIIKKYNLKRITFHGLRHTNVSLMISKGIQTQIISRKVGHSSVQVTDRIYSHFFDDEFKNVSNVMDDVFARVN